jgi:hypothetical protein
LSSSVHPVQYELWYGARGGRSAASLPPAWQCGEHLRLILTRGCIAELECDAESIRERTTRCERRPAHILQALRPTAMGSMTR